MWRSSRPSAEAPLDRPASLIAVFVVCTVVASCSGWLSSPTSAVGLGLSLSMSPDTVMVCSVDAGPVALLTGSAVVDQNRLVHSVVELTASSKWVSLVNPPTMVFDSEAPQTFSVTVHVPLGALPTDSCVVAVSGVCKVGGIIVSNATTFGTVLIQDYSVFNLETDVALGYLRQGEDRDITLRVHNRANVPLRFDISVKAVPDGATVLLPRGTPEFGPYEIGNYTFELRTERDIGTDYQFITFLVRAYDTGGEEVQTREFFLPLDIEGRTEGLVANNLPSLVASVIAASSAIIIFVYLRRRRRKAHAATGVR